MKNYSSYILILVSILLVDNIIAQKLDHVLGEVIVEVKNDAGAKRLVSELASETRGRSTIEAYKLMSEPMNLWILKVDPNVENEIEFLENIKLNKHTLLAQQNHQTQLRQTMPNDALFDNQWQYINLGSNGGEIGADIDMELAWDHTTGGKTVDGDDIVVCVIDDGLIDHPDFEDNLWSNIDEIPDNGIDDDENGYIDDVRGWNAELDSDNIFIDGSHGTSVAGVIGAKGNNEIGVAGVNWDVKLMIVKGGSPESLALASYAYPYQMRKLYNETNGEKGAFVVATNSSWGIDLGNPEDAPIWCDFYNILGEVGILNFGATANANTDVDQLGDLPTGCKSDYLVSVTNLNRQDEKVFGAGFGARSIDLGAYGRQTYTIDGTNYGTFGGTSAATPHCAGTAALLYATDCTEFMSVVKSDPAQAALAVKDHILHGVQANQSLQDITTTGGRLNANNAMLNLLSTCDECTAAYGANVSTLGTESVQISWLDNGKIGDVSLRYKEVDDSDWIEIENPASGYTLENLKICTEYEYQIKTNCDINTDADYTYSRVFQTDGCCIAPDGVTATLSGDIVTIDWAGVTAATNFIIEYKNSTNEEWLVADLGTENTFAFDGIEDCQYYEVRIKSLCAATSNESEYTEIIGITTECGNCTGDYCIFEVKNTQDEWIESVSIVDIFENVSGTSNDGYASFLGQFDIELNLGQEYEINMTPGYTDSVFDEYFSVYIDYDQNGEFEEDELVYNTTESTQTTVTGFFSIPLESELGITRMRVIMRYNDPIGSACDDDNSFEFGEIEDYCVNILPAVNTVDVAETSIQIYPTLTSDMINIDLNDNTIKSGFINIRSASSGMLIEQTPILTNRSSYSIDISDQPTGVYLVIINTDENRIVQKLMKI